MTTTGKQAAKNTKALRVLQQSRVLQARWRLTLGLETCLALPPPIRPLIVAQPHFSHPSHSGGKATP
jgi:hypothetical protein